MEFVQQTMSLKKERQRQPVVTKDEGMSLPRGLNSEFGYMTDLSFEDVRVHYSPLKSAETGACAYPLEKNVYREPGQGSHLPHKPSYVVRRKQGRTLTAVNKDGLKRSDSISRERKADMRGDAVPQEKRKGEHFSDDRGMCFYSGRYRQPGTQGSIMGSLIIQMRPDSKDYRIPNDSEDISDSFYSQSDSEDNFNVASVKMTGRKPERHVSEPGPVAEEARLNEKLVSDARKILAALPNKRSRRATTVVCAAFRMKDGIRHYAMINGTLMGPKMRKRAGELGYIIIRGATTHAEANLILYANKHRGNARLISFGCDKKTCPQCEILLNKFFRKELSFPSRGIKKDGGRQWTDKYNFRGGYRKGRGDGQFVRRMRDCINSNYLLGKRRELRK